METINHECYVSLEVANLLKEAGFVWECKKIYFKTGWKGNDDIWEIEDNNKKTKRVLELDYCLLAPTLDVAQRWLREVKRISIEAGIDVHEKWKVLCCKYPVNNEWPDNWCLLDDTDETNPSYPTYEDAIEAGIKKSLEIILKKGE